MPRSMVVRGPHSALPDALVPIRWYRRPHVRNQALGLGSVIGFLLLWESISRLGLLDQRFIPRPSIIAIALGSFLLDGTLFKEIRTTLVRVFSGYALGVGAGLALGFGMGLSRALRAALYPIFVGTLPLPKVALLPLSMLFLGMGDAPIVALVAVSALYLLPFNVMSAVNNVNSTYKDVARNLGVERWLYWRTVALPFALPMIFGGLRSAWAVSLIVVVAGEMLIGSEGLGFMIWSAVEVMQIERMFSAFVAIAFLGYMSHMFLELLGRVVIPWQPGD